MKTVIKRAARPAEADDCRQVPEAVYGMAPVWRVRAAVVGPLNASELTTK